MRRLVPAFGWTVVFLVILDVAVNTVFRYPAHSNTDPPGFLTRYFEYGRSIEGKLVRMIGPDDASTDPVALAGWLDPESWKDLPDKSSAPDKILIADYGMSFSFDVGRTLQKINPRYELRCIGGPTAPVSHSYAAFTLDRTRNQAQIALIGILASSVRALTTMTGQTWAFESPYPYTYPRYRVATGGKLDGVWPMITSMEAFRDSLNQPERWDAFVQQLRENDDYYDPFLFHHNALDSSVMVRLLRRGWGQRENQTVMDSIHGPKGFKPDTSAVAVLKAIVTNFKETAQADGRLPVVLLLNDQGYGDHLYRILEPTLREQNIPYVSTHETAPATDLKNFVADGHFTEAAYHRIALLLEDLIQKRLK